MKWMLAVMLLAGCGFETAKHDTTPVEYELIEQPHPNGSSGYIFVPIKPTTTATATPADKTT